MAIAACSGGDDGSPRPSGPDATATNAPVETPPTVWPTPVPPAPGTENLTLKVMSFNLLWGAGYDRRFDGNVGPRFRHDRVPELVAFLKQANPDILALQEAAGWDTGDPSLAQQVATELGLTYVLAPDAWELHVILFSRYPIVAADYVSRLQDFNGVALRATLAVAPDLELNAFVVHLNSMSRQTRSCQVEAILDMAAGLEGRTLLIGDMNFRPTADQAEALRAAGWQLVAEQERWPIDQIWADGSGHAATSRWWEDLQPPDGISDHWPVGVQVSLAGPFSEGTANGGPVAVPQPLDYACPLPER